MDYRNDNRTPRDRVDDEFFRSLLREEDEEQEMHRNRSNTRMTGAGMQSRSRMNSRTLRERSTQDTCPRRSCTREVPPVDHCPADSWGDDCLSGYPLGMVYIPAQSFKEIMDPQSALRTGTIFLQLDLPFYHSGCKGDMCR